MPGRSGPLMDVSVRVIGPMAERCQNLVDDMNLKELSLSSRKRALKAKDKLARETSARMLVANLYQHWKADPKGTIGVMLTKNWYSHRRQEIGPDITYGGVKGFLDYLCGRHLIEIVSKGRKHPNAKQGIPTQVRAKQGLIDYLDQGDVSPSDISRTYPSIILKASRAEGKKPLRLERNEVTQELEAGVNQINKLLLNRWADLEIPDADMAKLREEGINLPSRLYTHRTVYRVFNNGSFDQGRRFYGGWWQQIPSGPTAWRKAARSENDDHGLTPNMTRAPIGALVISTRTGWFCCRH